MTWRRHLRMVRATLALWVLGVIAVVSDVGAWVRRRLGRERRIPRDVHVLVALVPDDPPGEVTTIDLTDRDHAAV